MRELNQRDLILLKNVQKMLKYVQFSKMMDYEEALAVGQTDSFFKGFISEIEASLQKKLNDEKLKAAIAQAKEVTPEKTESLKDQAPIGDSSSRVEESKKGKKK